jgi:hypothetical protein
MGLEKFSEKNCVKLKFAIEEDCVRRGPHVQWLDLKDCNILPQNSPLNKIVFQPGKFLCILGAKH